MTSQTNPTLLTRLTRGAASLILLISAAAHILMLMSLLLILAAVTPAYADTCRGENLLDKLAKEDPQHFAAVVEESRAIPNGNGLFWKIEREGSEPSYLLGTMHVTDPRVLEMPKGAAEAHASARTIVIESDEILDDKKAMAAILLDPELTMFTDGRSIESLLDPRDRATLEEGLKKRGLALSAVSRMKPWMLAGFVASSACEMARKADGAAFLDKKIALDALDAGKPVRGLETLREQLAAMTEMPLEFHLEALVETVKLGDRMHDVVETMTALYLAGEIGMTIPVLKAVTPTDGREESAYAAFESAVISDRNKRMAERAALMLADGGVFMAVGALHLPGDDGLVELIRKQGYTVTLAR